MQNKTKTFITFLSMSLLFSCKGTEGDNNLASTSPNSSDAIVYDVSVGWSQDTKSTDVKVSNSSTSIANFVVESINQLESSKGFVSQAGEDYVALADKAAILPVLNVEIVIQSPHQWCYPSKAISLGTKGALNCYDPTSDKGQFVKLCLDSAGKVSNEANFLHCTSIDKYGLNDKHSFTFGKEDPKKPISLLHTYRTVQEICNSNTLTPNGKIMQAKPSSCSCSANGEVKEYDMWYASLTLSHDSWDQALKESTFAAVCNNLAELPELPSSILNTDIQPDEPVEPSIGTRVPGLLDQMCEKIPGGSINGDTCKCNLYNPSGSLAEVKNASLLSGNIDQFLNECLGLENPNYFEEGSQLCEIIGSTGSFLDTGTCDICPKLNYLVSYDTKGLPAFVADCLKQ